MLGLAGRQHGRVVGCVVRRVSGCSGIDMTDCLRTSRRVGLRSKGRREDECGEQNAGQMAMAAHWGKDTVQRRQSTSQTSWGTMIAGPAGAGGRSVRQADSILRL
jgi:hypothetical protein